MPPKTGYSKRVMPLVLLISSCLSNHKDRDDSNTQSPIATATILNSHGNETFGVIHFYRDVVFTEFNDGKKFSISFPTNRVSGHRLGPFFLEDDASNTLAAIHVSLEKQQVHWFKTRLASQYALDDVNQKYRVEESWSKKGVHLWALKDAAGKCHGVVRPLPQDTADEQQSLLRAFHILVLDEQDALLPILLVICLNMQKLTELPGVDMYVSPQETPVDESLKSFILSAEKEEFLS